MCVHAAAPECPVNSHFESCGSACPATCQDPDAPSKCKTSCVEACTCNDGFLRSGNKCVPKGQCGCMYIGNYVEAGASFWGDESCTQLIKCSAGGILSGQDTSCPLGKQCQVVKGIRDCYNVTYATCMVSGDPHFVTFDGQRYNFHGTCVYEMASFSANQSSLEPFSVVVQNNGQDKRIGTIIKLIGVKVYGYTIIISKEHPGFVMVTNLPFQVSMYIHPYEVD